MEKTYLHNVNQQELVQKLREVFTKIINQKIISEYVINKCEPQISLAKSEAIETFKNYFIYVLFAFKNNILIPYQRFEPELYNKEKFDAIVNNFLSPDELILFNNLSNETQLCKHDFGSYKSMMISIIESDIDEDETIEVEVVKQLTDSNLISFFKSIYRILYDYDCEILESDFLFIKAFLKSEIVENMNDNEDFLSYKLSEDIQRLYRKYGLYLGLVESEQYYKNKIKNINDINSPLSKELYEFLSTKTLL